MFRRSFVTDHKSAQTIPASTKTATFRQMPFPQRRYSAASRYGSCSHFCTIFRLLGRLSGFNRFCGILQKLAAHRSISSSVGFSRCQVTAPLIRKSLQSCTFLRCQSANRITAGNNAGVFVIPCQQCRSRFPKCTAEISRRSSIHCMMVGSIQSESDLFVDTAALRPILVRPADH